MQKKKIMSDVIWSISGLVLMNVIAQFVVYPSWSNSFGSERYGEIIFLISLMNVFSVSLGMSTNYCRVINKTRGGNSTYNIVLGVASTAGFIYAFLCGMLSGVTLSAGELMLYMLLTVVTSWRYYVDVEYRLNINYKGYFIYYLVVGVGYLIGGGLLLMTKLWPLALLPGEILGVIWVYLKGGILKPDKKAKKEELMFVVKTMLVLFASDVVSNIIFNGDRILLKSILDGTAVAVYYQASLIGKTMTLITAPLNSVIIGHLSRYEGKLTVKLVNIIVVCTLGMITVFSALSIIASHIIIGILYPDTYQQVQSWFLQGNLPQIIYFSSGIVIVILLRFTKAKYSMTVNIIYALGFCLVCIPMTIYGGLEGFYSGIFWVAFLRYISAVTICYIKAFKNRKTVINK